MLIVPTSGREEVNGEETSNFKSSKRKRKKGMTFLFQAGETPSIFYCYLNQKHVTYFVNCWWSVEQVETDTKIILCLFELVLNNQIMAYIHVWM